MAMKINGLKVKKGEQTHPVTKPASVFLVETTGIDISIDGQVSNAGITVTCTVTRHFRDTVKPNHSAWTQTLFGVSDPQTGAWSVDIGDLPEGDYMLVIAAEGEGIDCVELVVKGSSELQHVILIAATDAKADHITVRGTVLFLGESVQCSLCAMLPSGACTGTVKSKLATISSKTWTVTFTPSELGLTAFSGLYHFSAVSYEGTVSEPIKV